MRYLCGYARGMTRERASKKTLNVAPKSLSNFQTWVYCELAARVH
jgi:hypothetical protein